MNLKNILITLSSIAVLLGLITFYVVFYGNTGTYVVNSDNASNTVFSTSTITLPSSTVSSTLSLSSSSASSSVGVGLGGSSSSAEFTSDYTTPPITWMQGNETMAITNATLSGSQLTFQLQITMGAAAECVPLDIEIVTDENGDLAPPVDPQFNFPDSGTCTGTAGETYTDQQVVFNVDPSALPLILNTGGSSNILFEVDTTPQGALTIQLPPSAD